MADSTSVVLETASIPTSAELKRAKDFTREPFLHEGEQPEEVLAPGTARRRALDAALAEIEDGAEHPSVQWRRDFSLLLGLERLLAADEPKLADGTDLTGHQVDALSGTLAALTAEVQRNGNGNGALTAPELPELASSAIPGEEEEDEEVGADE